MYGAVELSVIPLLRIAAVKSPLYDNVQFFNYLTMKAILSHLNYLIQKPKVELGIKLNFSNLQSWRYKQ